MRDRTMHEFLEGSVKSTQAIIIAACARVEASRHGYSQMYTPGPILYQVGHLDKSNFYLIPRLAKIKTWTNCP